MSGKSRRGKKRRHDDDLAEYRAYAKDPLYADYCKQVIALLKRGRQMDLPDELLASCSPAAIITAMLELSEYRCASWREGCPVHAPKLDRRATRKVWKCHRQSRVIVRRGNTFCASKSFFRTSVMKHSCLPT